MIHTMTTAALAEAWGAPRSRIQRWCRCELLESTKTARGWRIDGDARPPYRDSKMILKWIETDQVVDV